MRRPALDIRRHRKAKRSRVLAVSGLRWSDRFARNDDRPLFAFAGIWTEFKGYRGTNEGKSKDAAKETKRPARQRKVG